MNEEIKAEVDHAPNPPKHHQAPWIHSENHPTDIIDEKGDFLGRFLCSENTEFAARAVNTHDDLVAALKDGLAHINSACTDSEEINQNKSIGWAIETINAALLKVRGE